MNTNIESSLAGQKFNQLFRMCNVIRWMLLIFWLVQIGFFILSWALQGPIKIGSIHMQFDLQVLPFGETVELDGMQRTIGVLIGLPGLLTLTYAVRRLGQMISQFQKGNIFATLTINHARTFTGAALITSVLSNIEKPLRNLILNLISSGDTGYRTPIEVTSNELLLLLVCGLFYLVVGVMQEGRRLSEENEAFI
ncbi:MAG: DUF2975 domain-containing protein [Burkholderiales bacterium]|nr:DUF2975 domain-containing protein [Burkholderiales bacterium]